VISSSFGEVTGLEVYKGSANMTPTLRRVYGVQAVIEYAPDTPSGYMIVTAFPTSNVNAFPGVTQ
jgi:hypothetical protein